MTEDELRRHLVDCHAGAHMPWFFNDDAGGGWIDNMRADQLERLHDELHRQGERHVDVEPAPAAALPEFDRVRVMPVPKGPCARPWCRALAARADGLCRAHGAEQKG